MEKFVFGNLRARISLPKDLIVKSVGGNQQEIIKGILYLYCPDGIDLDPTYSKGVFYKGEPQLEPKYKSDLFPCVAGCEQSNANKLRFDNCSLKTIMFDPPFIVGHERPTGKIGKRFSEFKNITELWKWYDECLREFYRILKPKGILIFKCQDMAESGHQRWSHLHIMNEAEKIGYYNRDLFVLIAKHRFISFNCKKQHLARKYHSYFLVLEKL
jgi:hypothetical protein